MDQREATDFAARWERDWNAHDLDALLAHFAEDVVFTSPVAVGVNYRNHAGNRVCEYLAFEDGLVVAGHATYQTDAAAAASGIAGS